jgi:hypothetical protein
MGEHAKAEKAPSRIRGYAKFVVALGGAVSAGATTLTLSDGPLTWQDWLNTAIAFGTALGVFGVSNEGKDKG